MGELGDLLEVLHNADRLRTFEGEFLDWTFPSPSSELVVYAEDIGDGRRLRWGGPGPFARPAMVSRRIWFEQPNRLRVELLRNGNLERFGVREGDSWWRWDEIDGAHTGSLTPAGAGRMPPPLLDPPLLSPARLIAALRLDPKGRGMRAGREVLLVRARPREESTVRRGVLFELEFDAEHGLLLRRELFQEGRCVQLTEALTVRYDEPIDPGRFVFAPPDERSLHRSEDAHGTVESSTDGDGSDVSYADQPRSEEPRGLGAGATVWLTGLPGSGKTALGLALRGSFEKLGCQMCLLDGDALREGLSADLGMTPADRSEQARRAMHVAALVSGSGVVVVVALVSPYAADRLRARELHGRLGLRFYEVWVDTPLEICEQRDPKGFFARARSGSLRDLTGVDAPYEPPQTPEMRVSGCREPVERVAARIVELISPRNRPPAAGVA